MEIVPLTPEYRSAWDNFCLTSPDAWFWHTTAWIDFNLAYRPELQQKSLSFLYKEGDRILAVVPLLLGCDQRDGKPYRFFSFCGIPIPAPALAEGLSAARRMKLMESIFELIEGLAQELEVAHSHFRIVPLSPACLKPKYAIYNDLLRYRYLDCSSATQMIDLRLNEQELWAGVRRDHQRNIVKAREALRIQIHSGDRLTEAKFDEYRLMHARAAGRVTRPAETFRMMRDWIRSGDGFIAEACLADGKSVGFETFHGYKGSGYSMSACNEPGYGRLPIRHLVQWESILWMKTQGLEFYEVGPQHFGFSICDFPDQKKRDISLFKSGFGGVTVPVLQAERFHSRLHWDQEHRRRTDLFTSGYSWEISANAEQARSLLQLLEETGKPHAPKPEETELIPESVRTLAAEAVHANPDAVQRYRNGSTKVVAFLVGTTMQRVSKDVAPQFVRRAIEELLAQSIAAEKQS
ncbi:MAG: GatB/YqeY domain-containing protein [Sulfuritalea sp.]|nr:GatB/YqeY domain-containing protein [Sulfuritalea sp.]